MALIDLDTTGLKDVAFGQEIREKEFCLRPGSIHINNGSYGNVPKRVMEIQRKYLLELEGHPDHWFRRQALLYWDQARAVMADFVGADVQDVVFVMNSTQGINTVLRSCKLEPGDAILASSLTYFSLKNLWTDMAHRIRPGVEGLMIELSLPITSEDDLVQRYDHYLSTHPNVKFVLLDHITSSSAILMPVKRLAKVCHRHGAMVMVDGAHAPGQVHLHLNDLGVDFYTGNMNKWAYSPRGCALLWVKREHQRLVAPPSTSWLLGQSLSEQFSDQGTQDQIPFFCVKHALQFYNAIGGSEKIGSYLSDLATRGRDLLVEELDGEQFPIPPSLEAPNLRLVVIPAKGANQDTPQVLMDILYQQHDMQTVWDWVDGRLCLRISLQVHNTLDDIHKLISVLKPILAKGF